MGSPKVGWGPLVEDVVRAKIGIHNREVKRSIIAVVGEDDPRRGPRQSL